MNKHLETATVITDLLENRFKIFGLRFGLDPILGLIPGAGDFLAFLIATYLLWIGTQMKLPPEKLTRMLANIVLDLLVGTTPILEDVFDFAYKANSKNLALLKEHQAVTKSFIK